MQRVSKFVKDHMTQKPVQESSASEAPSQGNAPQGAEKTPKSAEDKQTQVKTAEPIERKEQPQIVHGLYVYGIIPYDSPKDFGEIGVVTGSSVHTIPYKDVAAVVSEFHGANFERTDENVLAHQRVFQKVAEKTAGIPVRFGTIVENDAEVQRILEEGYPDFKKELSELGGKEGAAVPIESTSPTDIIAQILSQSAASAIKIRQMSDSLDEVRRQEYDRSAARLPEGAAKQLLDFLAHAPPGSYEVSDTQRAVAGEQMQGLEKRLDSLLEEISGLKGRLVSSSSGVAPEAIETFTGEQKKIRESLGDLRNLYTENAATVSFQLGTLMGNFEKLKTAYSEGAASVERAVKETIEKLPSAVGEAVSKNAGPTMSDMVSIERTVRQTINEAMAPFVTQALTAGAVTPVTSDARAQQQRMPTPEYSICAGCGAPVGANDSFCDRCGWPTAASRGPGGPSLGFPGSRNA